MSSVDPEEAMAGPETRSTAWIHDALTVLVALGALGTLGYLAFHVVEIEFRLGTRIGVRSAAGIALPLLAGGYAFAARRGAAGGSPRLPAAVRFVASFAVAWLTMTSLRLFLRLLAIPIPIAELLIASCIAIVALAAARALVARGTSRPPLASALGVATGMLLFIAWYGLPRIAG
jgi:hypothetical protein